jgi:dTDP-4-dehydrorhamnose 3,5-epimerase-like enzyme
MSTGLAKFIHLPLMSDPRGNLSFVESSRHVPFAFNRVYYIYDIPSGSVRARHAHWTLHQLLIPVSGSFDVRLHDGEREETVTLNRPNIGLHVEPMVWHDLLNFSSGSVCVALASAPYDESDYIRHFDKFMAAVQK